MRIEHLAKNFEKRNAKTNLIFNLGAPASENQIKTTEKMMNVDFPDQIKMFYKWHNGLEVEDPPLDIFSLKRLAKYYNLIHFSNINTNIRLCFDCSKINQANQWDIIKCDNGFLITLTFSSFWSNKIWNWIDKRRNIWEE